MRFAKNIFISRTTARRAYENNPRLTSFDIRQAVDAYITDLNSSNPDGTGSQDISLECEYGRINPREFLSSRSTLLQRKPASSIWSRYVGRIGFVALAVVMTIYSVYKSQADTPVTYLTSQFPETFGGVPNLDTLFDSINKVRPDHMLICQDSKIKEH